MQGEGRHRYIKSNAQSSNCKRNLLKTIAIKQTLKMCQLIHTLQFEKEITFGSINIMDETKTYFKDDMRDKQCKYLQIC